MKWIDWHVHTFSSPTNKFNYDIFITFLPWIQRPARPARLNWTPPLRHRSLCICAGCVRARWRQPEHVRGHDEVIFRNDPRCSKGLNVLTLAFDAGRASWSCQVVGLGIALELFNQQVNLVASSNHVIQLGEKTCKHMHQFSWGTFTTAPFVAIFRTLKG